MAELEAKIILIPEKRYREMYKAQAMMEILQDYRNTHDDFDFERFALNVFKKPEKEEKPDA